MARNRLISAASCSDCSPKTLRNMLDAGLIVDVGGETRRDAFGSYRVPAYAMPIPVNMQ